MKRRPVNLGRSDEHIAEQYPNIFEGLQKDAAQNAWDAKLTKKGKDWKLFFKIIPDRKILIIEDFGTTGMNAKKWMEYQSLWDTTKAEEDTLGARGQGKFLFHYFSRTKLVLTETIDETGKYRFSWGNTEEWDDEGKNLEDFIPGARPLDHQGTRIWIMDIKIVLDILETLLDCRTFMKYIAATWWEIIRNWNATFIVNFDGVDRQVTLPSMPLVKKERVFPNERVKNIGKIRNLVLYYCDDEVPVEWRGIAVQRGGMTVLRLPVVAEENIKNRIYGYCDFDESLERELKKCEFPNHFGFRPRKPWNHVREFIRHKLDDFLLEITPRKEKIEVAADVLEKAVKLVNNLVGEYAPELLSGPSRIHTDTLPPLPLRIGVFRPNQRKFEYNETLLIDCEIINETREDRNLSLQITVNHKDGTEKHKSRYNFDIASNTRKKIDIPLIDFEKSKDKKGVYYGKVILVAPSERQEIDKKGFTIYLHEEPPVPPPGGTRGRAFVSYFRFLRGKKPDGTMQYFAKWKNLPITDKGVVWIVADYPDFIRVRELATSKKARNREVLLYCAKCGIDEAFRKLLELRYADNRLDPDEIKRIKNICDEMIYEGVIRTV